MGGKSWAWAGVAVFSVACGNWEPRRPAEPVEEVPDVLDDRPVTEAGIPPAPIAGGTLAVARDDTAWASDPDRDLVWHVDLVEGTVLSATSLAPGEEPGRIVVDAVGRAHVALRQGGAVATIDPSSAQDVRRTAVCPEPRGLAYDVSDDVVHVACTSGDLVTIAASDGRIVRRLALEPDLRDVVVEGDRLYVSVFKSARVLVLDADGTVSPVEIPNFQDAFEPEVAWRMVAAPGGGVVVAHQRAQVRTPVVIDHQCSYGGCVDVAREVDMGPIVHSAVSVLVPGEAASQAPILPGVLPVDIAVGPDAVYTQFAVATTGSNEVETGSLVGSVGMPDAYGYAMPEPVAVGFDSAGRLVAQSRLPAQIQVRDGATVLVSIPLGNDPIVHTGHEIFHHPPDGGAALACASCHPEGREDGRPWNFADIGVRRTQSLAGGIRDTAPYHWDGAMGSLAELMGDVFTERMGGPTLAQPRIDALAHWLDTVPLPAPPDGLDPDAVARGREIFDGPTAACSTCHAGERLSNEATIDVGTGGAFQVPSLRGLAARAPYLHTGCAATLAERFDPQCGGTAHGNTADLTAAETADLVAYLETL